MVVDVNATLAALAACRAVFHSEADFQHALAWQMQLADPAARVRLETRPLRGARLDVLLESRGNRQALELKYLVRRFHGVVDGELFDLSNQGTQDISRYDVVKDIKNTGADCPRAQYAPVSSSSGFPLCGIDNTYCHQAADHSP